MLSSSRSPSAAALSRSSTFLASAAMRRKMKPSATRRNGSGERKRPLASVEKREGAAGVPCAQSQPDATSAFPSRTMWPPRQLAMTAYLGRPRLPPPFTRDVKRTIDASAGRLSRSPVATAAGGSADGRLAISAQKTSRSPSEQVECVGHEACIVEIVDAPHEPPLGITPGPEILDMGITHRQYGRRALEFAEPDLDQLAPTKESGAKEGQRIATHPRVLTREARIDNRALCP